ncbi:MAG: iron ABC transporter permease [Thermoanaerobaculia bacterium]
MSPASVDADRKLLRSRARWFRPKWARLQQRLLLGAVALVVAIVAGAPLLALLTEMLRAGEGTSSLLVQPVLWTLFGRTVAGALVVTAASILIGVPAGFVFARTDVPGRRLLWLVHTFPLFVPPFLLALGWSYVFDRGGSLTEILFSTFGVVLVLTLALTPVVTALTAVALAGIEPALEESARVVATPLRTALGVLLPAARPAVALGGLIVFSLAVSELGVPLFLGSRTYAESVFSRLGGIDYAPGEAVVLATPLLAVGLLLVIIERRFVGRRRFELVGLRQSREPFPLGRWRPPATMLAVGLGVAAATPLAGLAWRAMRESGLWSVGAWLGESLWTSLGTALAAAAVALVIGCLVGHAVVQNLPVGRVLDTLLFLAFLTPAAVLGVGLITAWNRPETWWLYRGWPILVLAGAARYSILAVRTATIAFAQSSPRLEEAGQVAGAGFGRRLISLVIPLHWRGLVLAFVLTFVFCFRDLDMVILFYPPGREPLMVRIFTLEANGPSEIVAALAMVQVLVVAAVLAIGGLALTRTGTG